MFEGKYKRQKLSYGNFEDEEFEEKKLEDFLDSEGKPKADKYKDIIRKFNIKIGELQAIAIGAGVSAPILLVMINKSTGHRWDTIKYKNFEAAKDWVRLNISRWFEIIAPEIYAKLKDNKIYTPSINHDALVKSI